MEKRKRILLYGKSVILGTVGVSLQRHREFEILPAVSPSLAGCELRALSPDVIIYDIKASHPEAAISLLENCPNLLLIGLCADRDEMLVLASHPSQVLSVQDLVQVIQQKESKSESFERKEK